MFSLQANDFLKGLVVAVFSAIFTSLLQMLQNGFEGIEPKTIALVAVISAISYILKNYLSDENGKVLGKI